jgi:hypothetical protein
VPPSAAGSTRAETCLTLDNESSQPNNQPFWYQVLALSDTPTIPTVLSHVCRLHGYVVPARYEDWRRRVLSGVRAGRRLRNMLLWTIIPALAALQVSFG